MRSVVTCKTFSKPVPMKFDPSGVPQRLINGLWEVWADWSTSVYRSNPRLWSGHPEAIQIAVHQSIGKKTEHLVTDRIVSELNARSAAHYQRSRSPEIQTWYYHFMTALVDSGHVSRKNLPFDNLCTTDLRLTSQAFGREPNALPKLCNLLRSKSLGSPGRIRTSNISVNSRETNFIRTCRSWH